MSLPGACRRWVTRAAGTLLAVAFAVPALAQSAGEGGTDGHGTAGQAGAADRFNRFAARLSPDEPLYFVAGWRDGTNAKFQLSFKYRFVNPAPEDIRSAPFFRRVYFGYSQTSIWDLASQSKPFYDTSYRPSLFYRHEKLAQWGGGGAGAVWAQLGFEHESNGQGGEESRSLNTIYLQPVLELDRAVGSVHLTVAPRLLVYVGSLADNPDIADYRGHGQLSVALTGRTEWQVAATGRVGTSGKGSVQVDFTFPLDRLIPSLDAYLHVQFFDGWGESLRSYDVRLPWQLRIGIAAFR